MQAIHRVIPNFMNETKPKVAEVVSLDQRQEDRISALEKGQQEILALLRPISATYTTVSTMGRWSMAFMVFISILIGLILGFRNLFK